MKTPTNVQKCDFDRAMTAETRAPQGLSETERKIIAEIRDNAAVTGEEDTRKPTDFRREQRRLLAIIDRLASAPAVGEGTLSNLAVEKLKKIVEDSRYSSEFLGAHIRLIWDQLYPMLSAAPQPNAGGAGGAAGNRLSLDNERQVFFYEQDHYYLSNFSAFTLQWHGKRFDTAEAAYHWTKFMPDDLGIANMIHTAPSAHEAFKLAQKYKSVQRADWNEVKIVVMRDILREKAAQHEYVRRKLLDTGERELIENSWRDDFWGWGPNRDGQNTLGKLWMEVRDELRSTPKGASPSDRGFDGRQT